MNTLRDVVCTLIVMVVVGYLALILWCLYVLVGIAFVIIVTTLIVLAYGFLMEWRELTADEDVSARQRFAEETGVSVISYSEADISYIFDGK